MTFATARPRPRAEVSCSLVLSSLHTRLGSSRSALDSCASRPLAPKSGSGGGCPGRRQGLPFVGSSSSGRTSSTSLAPRLASSSRWTGPTTRRVLAPTLGGTALSASSAGMASSPPSPSTCAARSRRGIEDGTSPRTCSMRRRRQLRQTTHRRRRRVDPLGRTFELDAEVTARAAPRLCRRCPRPAVCRTHVCTTFTMDLAYEWRLGAAEGCDVLEDRRCLVPVPAGMARNENATRRVGRGIRDRHSAIETKVLFVRARRWLLGSRIVRATPFRSVFLSGVRSPRRRTAGIVCGSAR